MLLRASLVLVSLPLLVHGSEGLFVALRSRTPAEMSCAQYFAKGSPSAWVKLTGCELDYVNAGYRDAGDATWRRWVPGSGFRISELVFPVREKGSDRSLPARLLVTTSDPVVLAIAETAFSTPAARDQESFLVTMLQVVTAMQVSRDVEGLLRGPLARRRSGGSVAAVHGPVAEDVAVLDLHERPGAVVPGIEVLLGLLALYPLVRARRRRAETAIAVPSGPPLMLLNLPQGASASEIEHAPPLGSQAEVRSLLVMSLPGIEFDERGVGTFKVRAGAVQVDLRDDDPVVTAVVTVMGAAAPAVARLLDETGWQAFAPKAGVFVPVNDLRAGGRPR
jgi:hypothetical protein